MKSYNKTFLKEQSFIQNKNKQKNAEVMQPT